MSDSAWTNVTTYRDSIKYDVAGEVGKLYGVRFAEAPSIPILVNSGSANVDLYRTLIFGPDFLGQADLNNITMVVNEPAKSSELGIASAFGYHFCTAYAIVNNSDGVRIESSASRGNDA